MGIREGVRARHGRGEMTKTHQTNIQNCQTTTTDRFKIQKRRQKSDKILNILNWEGERCLQNKNVPDSDRVSRSCSEVDVILETQNLWIHSSHGWSLLPCSSPMDKKRNTGSGLSRNTVFHYLQMDLAFYWKPKIIQISHILPLMQQISKNKRQLPFNTPGAIGCTVLFLDATYRTNNTHPKR